MFDYFNEIEFNKKTYKLNKFWFTLLTIILFPLIILGTIFTISLFIGIAIFIILIIPSIVIYLFLCIGNYLLTLSYSTKELFAFSFISVFVLFCLSLIFDR